jgi:predicted nuclease of predicted toxin-antitoxin system
VTVWLDAHLSPALAPWLAATFGVTAVAVRDLGLRDALDPPIFDAARAAGAVVMTKDADFAEIVDRLGTPPQVIWVQCGNTSNAALRTLFASELPTALIQLAAGVAIVEVGSVP